MTYADNSKALTWSSQPGALGQLIDLDWDFIDARTHGGIHGVHPYPARFIPQIPRQLIKILSPRPGCIVLDPFCGSGTTLVEAQAAGHRAVGIDLNPIATLIARVKTQPPFRSVLPTAKDLIAQARLNRVDLPSIPRVNHWFSAEVQQALSALIAQFSQVSDELVRDSLRMALSSIVVRVSYQDGDTRYAAVPKAVSPELVFRLFENAVAKLDDARSSRLSHLFAEEPPPVRVITSDIRSVSPVEIGGADLVITSPPYPNAYEYWLYHKYRMYWLGYDPLQVRAAEIGARPHFFKKDHHTAEDFEFQMRSVFALLRKVLRPDGLTCFVVASSMIHGEIVDNAALLRRAALAEGFGLLTTIDRRIPATRKAFNPSNARAAMESIAVFGRS